MRPNRIDGKTDLIVPSTDAYLNESFSVDRLFLVAIKTTCKDRWRQVLNEGKRISRKHLVTIQQGISENQLNEMAAAEVNLVVPRKFHRLYPKGSAMNLKKIEDLIAEIKIAYD